ncbi:helix-turn-helix domain-containing protein [Aurantiacibacter xanthus]|nr:helix-turn-helix domain-containing protein [Aurantiacibacter xanthus]
MNPPLHKEEIKSRIRQRYGSMLAFEREKGLMNHSVSLVLAGHPILPTAEAIADELDIPVHRVSRRYHDQYLKLAISPRHRGPKSEKHALPAQEKRA